MPENIKTIVGLEPHREGEYPVQFQVGFDGVTRIGYELQNFGTYGIGLYHVYKDRDLVCSLQQQAVAEVYYFVPVRPQE